MNSHVDPILETLEVMQKQQQMTHAKVADVTKSQAKLQELYDIDVNMNLIDEDEEEDPIANELLYSEWANLMKKMDTPPSPHPPQELFSLEMLMLE
ncbi:hypothetical protein TanjilG_15051 [Lupinus angustifolius]|uniref:Uncharacterized protein n=1 Tax=Lupinus angustifolius TaxID=3871 RepID=A0A1J7IK51_LUPAN|nr:hypothetical protein TanjilG_15051 [Lupinus angustifolius]